MTEKRWKILFAAVFLIGIIMIYFSADLGVEMAEAYMRRMGGMMDTGVHQIVMDNDIHTVQIIGTLICVFSGLAELAAWRK